MKHGDEAGVFVLERNPVLLRVLFEVLLGDASRTPLATA